MSSMENEPKLPGNHGAAKDYYFLSSFTLVPDAKGRVTLAASYREELGASEAPPLVLYQAMQAKKYPFISIYPRDVWFRELNALIEDAKSQKDRQAQLFVRKKMANCVQVSIDSAGRILVPKKMLEQCGIAKQALLCGVGNHMELWDPDEYERFNSAESADELELDEYVADKYGFML